MAFLIGGANSAADTGYEVANSVRFNSGDSPYMYKTPGSDGNRKTWTFSIWCKRGKLGVRGELFGVYNEDNDLTESFRFNTDDTLMYEEDISGADYEVSSTMLFRDPSAWYNIVLIRDTTESTEINRVKLFVNGVQDTLVESGLGFPAEDGLSSQISQQQPHYVGSGSNTAYFFDGYLAEAVFIDGTAYAATNFGEFDEDSPRIWKPKDVSGLTFGTNGFYLDYEDSGNLGNDANGGTDFTEANLAAADSSTDTPTNNFCTMNPLDNFYPASTFTEGNNYIVSGTSPYSSNTGTFGLTAGKWYFELKYVARGGSEDLVHVGIKSTQDTANDQMLGHFANDYGYRAYNGTIRNNNSDIAHGDTFAVNDIIGVAINIDDNELLFYKNGTAQNSGTEQAITAVASTPLGLYLPAISWNDGSTTGTMALNFGGCPAFAISSGNADENGYGNFEYAPPSGFLALCTKNLGSTGG